MANFRNFSHNNREGIRSNPLEEFEQLIEAQKEAEKYAAKVISSTPQGVISGINISGKTLKKHPGTGSLFLLGLATIPLFIIPLLWSAMRGLFFPAPVAQTAPMSHRVGNSVGRTLNSVWTLTKPGVAALEVNWRQEEAAKFGSQAQPRTQGGQTPVTTTNTPGLSLVNSYPGVELPLWDIARGHISLRLMQLKTSATIQQKLSVLAISKKLPKILAY